MRVFGILFLFVSLPGLAGIKLTTQVHDIDYGKNMSDDILLFLESGHVAKVSQRNARILDTVLSQKSSDTQFDFELSNDRYVEKVHVSPVKAATLDLGNYTAAGSKDDYVMTTIESMAKAKQYFREARYNPKESQCFNRALIWSYEWWKDHSLKSGKILIFFTRNYIRRYNFEWWFHIAPYVHIMDNGTVVERTMDRKYTSGPKKFREWTDIFMKNNAECNIITRYSEYADHPYDGECYLMRTNMYVYQPADLQMLEAWGYTKSAFVVEEVKGAYLEAFDEHH